MSLELEEQIARGIGASTDRDPAFPALGGAYDKLSLLIYTDIKGGQTYKDRLHKTSLDLLDKLLKEKPLQIEKKLFITNN